MRREENECVGCKELGLPCMGDACPNRHVVRLYCDECGDEASVLYEYDGEEMCESCVLDALPRTEV